VEDITEIKAAEEKLRLSELNLQNLAGRLIQAQEDERHRVGRELHDDIAQRLALHEIDLENLRDSLAQAGQHSQARLVSELHLKVDELTTDVHNLSRDLHSARVRLLGLRPVLRELCQKISAQQRILVSLHIAELPDRMPAELALCIYRVAQEALNNVVKHSRTHEALIELNCSDDTIALKVTDFGVGFDLSAAQAGVGFASMRERLRMFGGELFVESILGNGTEILARVKLKKANAATAD
jgi:signal transduction histidine kinase